MSAFGARRLPYQWPRWGAKRTSLGGHSRGRYGSDLRVATDCRKLRHGGAQPDPVAGAKHLDCRQRCQHAHLPIWRDGHGSAIARVALRMKRATPHQESPPGLIVQRNESTCRQVAQNSPECQLPAPADTGLMKGDVHVAGGKWRMARDAECAPPCLLEHLIVCMPTFAAGRWPAANATASSEKKRGV